MHLLWPCTNLDADAKTVSMRGSSVHPTEQSKCGSSKIRSEGV